MKYGIAIVWDGPESIPGCNDCYTRAMRDLISRELLEINKHFLKHSLKMLEFTVVEIPVANLNKKTDC